LILINLNFGSLLRRNLVEFQIVLKLNNNWQKPLQEPNVDVVPHVLTWCH